MALLSLEPIFDESLEKGEHIGSGGFGHVYKARHKDWGFDVALKLIHQPDGGQLSLSSPFMRHEKTLNDEANHMDKASCQFVLKVYGIYQGPQMTRGIVMEFMERGSIQTLQTDLSGPPPCPLAFRLAHEVALGMNFLHSKNLLHHDLKPSNVLLNDDLHAKLADFGLSRVSTSASIRSGETSGETSGVYGGSYKYMPPEAFALSYEPVRAFDIYSYGILLWSILTGKEPYPDKTFELVELRITQGDRPDCKDIDPMKAEGLKELVDLMKMCWDSKPSERPTFKDCLEVTGNVFSKHKEGIPDAVHQVLKRLGPLKDSPTTSQNSDKSASVSLTLQTQEQSSDPQSYDTVDHGRFMVQNSVSEPDKNLTDEDKATFVVKNQARLTQQVSEVLAIVEELGDMVHSETYSVIEAQLTSQAQMRVLYQRTFRSGGTRVKAAFYDVLEKHHPYLVQSLDG